MQICARLQQVSRWEQVDQGSAGGRGNGGAVAAVAEALQAAADANANNADGDLAGGVTETAPRDRDELRKAAELQRKQAEVCTTMFLGDSGEGEVLP